MTTDFGGPMEIPLFCNFQHGTAKEERAICTLQWIGRHDHDPSIEISMPWRRIRTRNTSAIVRLIDIRKQDARQIHICHSQHAHYDGHAFHGRKRTHFKIYDETIIKFQLRQEETIINLSGFLSGTDMAKQTSTLVDFLLRKGTSEDPMHAA